MPELLHTTTDGTEFYADVVTDLWWHYCPRYRGIMYVSRAFPRNQDQAPGCECLLVDADGTLR